MLRTTKAMKFIGLAALAAGAGATLYLTRHTAPVQSVIPPDGLILIDPSYTPEDLETSVIHRCHEDTIPTFDRTLAAVTEDQMVGLQNGLRRCKAGTKIRKLELTGRGNWKATNRALELARASRVDVGFAESAPISHDGVIAKQACTRPAMNSHTEDGHRPMRMELTRDDGSRLFCGLPMHSEIQGVIQSAQRPPKSIFFSW